MPPVPPRPTMTDKLAKERAATGKAKAAIKAVITTGGEGGDHDHAAGDGDLAAYRTKFGEQWGDSVNLAMTHGGKPMPWLIGQTKGNTDYPMPILCEGTTGLIGAAGGMGKSYLLLSLALAIAGKAAGVRPSAAIAGKDHRYHWFNFAINAAAGQRVIYLAGEESGDILGRRLWNVTQAMYGVEQGGGLTGDGQRALANLVARPLHGMGDIAINGNFGEYLKEMLDNERQKPALLIIDPLSRFSAMKDENDNAGATRLIQAIEGVSRARDAVDSAITTLVSHHFGKDAIRGGEADSTALRGASGLVDAVRWVATLTPAKDTKDGKKGKVAKAIKGFMTFTITKNNYGETGVERLIKRGEHGVLSIGEKDKEYKTARAAAFKDDDDDDWGNIV